MEFYYALAILTPIAFYVACKMADKKAKQS